MALSSDSSDPLIDADGRLHHLLRPAINAGGQGAVFLTREPNIGVKILQSPGQAADIIRDVRRLPIEDLTSIAAPLSTLRDLPGYVMVWLRGMVPLGTNRLPPSGRHSEIIDWYIDSGGLRRRLALSARLAEVIADLHGRGLVYVDLSMANVMVSDAGTAAEVRLIDLDNLRSAADQSLSVLTPRWAAPELFDHRPPTRQSDAYSLALVTFATLTGYHPFDDGDLVRAAPDGSPIRLAAAHGQVPSFIDPDDNSNSTARHLFPLDVILTPQLLGAYRRTFSSGRRNADARPTAAMLRRLLWRAHDQTIACSCRFTSYLSSGACAACDKPFDDALTLEVRASSRAVPAACIALSNGATTVERRHLPLPVEPRSRHDEVLQARVERGRAVLDPAPEWSCTPASIAVGGEALLEHESGAVLTLGAVPHAR